jgi:hypothetical protein
LKIVVMTRQEAEATRLTLSVAEVQKLRFFERLYFQLHTSVFLRRSTYWDKQDFDKFAKFLDIYCQIFRSLINLP